jgi:uncharacterized protein YggU (UPF0235/DUF167 family)
VRVREPAVKGKANKRVIELLSIFFKISKSSIVLASGSTAKVKVFMLDGLDPEQLEVDEQKNLAHQTSFLE